MLIEGSRENAGFGNDSFSRRHLQLLPAGDVFGCEAVSLLVAGRQGGWMWVWE